MVGDSYYAKREQEREQATTEKIAALTSRAEAAEAQVAALREAIEKLKKMTISFLNDVGNSEGSYQWQIIDETEAALSSLPASPATEKLQADVDKATKLADVFQTLFLEHTAQVKAFLLELSEISGPLFDPTAKVSVKEMCAALLAAAQHHRQWAHDKSDETEKLQARVKELEGALRPFAEAAASEWCTPFKSGDQIIESTVVSPFEFGTNDLRRAASALKGEG